MLDKIKEFEEILKSPNIDKQESGVPKLTSKEIFDMFTEFRDMGIKHFSPMQEIRLLSLVEDLVANYHLTIMEISNFSKMSKPRIAKSSQTLYRYHQIEQLMNQGLTDAQDIAEKLGISQENAQKAIEGLQELRDFQSKQAPAAVFSSPPPPSTG